ncbi:hypothetical protein [Nonomuraea sp. B19D2]|uniref:hypothetical protein n=1 Tax=Nonomuraea sp. B19D2 TaxID=3159561 RepID=UPI0032DBEC9C
MVAAAGAALLAGMLGAAPAAAEEKVTYKLKAFTHAREGVGTCPPADRQWFERNDRKGAPIAWTYTNGDSPCVIVVYSPRTTSRTCDFYFYVPSDWADGIVRFDFDTSDGKYVGGPGTYGLNEAKREGWHRIATGSLVSSISFTDANGQDYKERKLGWGLGEEYGIRQVCPKAIRESA